MKADRRFCRAGLHEYDHDADRTCPHCAWTSRQAYYVRNRERILKVRRRWIRKNRDKVREHSRKWRERWVDSWVDDR